MPYVKTTWENGVTPLNATNMNKIEDGIEGKVDKVAGTNGDIVTFGSNGAVTDSGKQIETSLTASSDSKIPTSKAVATHVTSAIATKANKVSSTTADHFVSFSDANGTLKDSGKSASDFSKVVAVTGTASGTALTGLTVDGTSYTIPQGGGSAGVSSIDGATGAISIGGGLTRNGQTINGPDLSGYLTSADAQNTYAPKAANGYATLDANGAVQGLKDVFVDFGGKALGTNTLTEGQKLYSSLSTYGFSFIANGRDFDNTGDINPQIVVNKGIGMHDGILFTYTYVNQATINKDDFDYEVESTGDISREQA